MTRFELARDKRITIAALVLDVLSVLFILLLVNELVAVQFGIQTFSLNHEPSWDGVKNMALFFVLPTQYLLAVVELIARYREDGRSFTLPIVFLPFGHVLRFLIMFALEAIVVAVKLVVYFLSVLIEFVLMICRLDKVAGTALCVDAVDRCLEPVEKFVNATYNFLYFNKIQTNGNIFNSVFNNCLTLWCINH